MPILATVKGDSIVPDHESMFMMAAKARIQSVKSIKVGDWLED